MSDVFESMKGKKIEDSDTKEDVSLQNQRRTPQESEKDLGAPFVETMGYKEQSSYKKGTDGSIEEAKWGEKGSSRPDGYDPKSNSIIEIKNYDITTAKGRNQLVRNIQSQTEKRKDVFGDDVDIIEVIDVKGQNVTVEDMDKLNKKLEENVPDVKLDFRW